jgi:hypothetical protein
VCCSEAAGIDSRREDLRRHVRDVGLTRVDFINPLRIQVEAGDGKTGLGEHHRLWQADVA